MSRTRTALTVVLAAGALAGAAVGPAFAATPSAAPKTTTLTVHAAKTSVAPKAKDTITGTLNAGKTHVSGQKVVLERRAAGAKSFTKAASAVTNTKGAVSFTVVPGTKKGQKEQYELVFAGTKAYRASHSGITIVTVK